MQASSIRGSEGAVYLEFLIAFFPVTILFFGAIQLGILFSARIIVEHAAVVAARAAIVVIPQSPEAFNGQAVGEARGARRDLIKMAATIPTMGTGYLSDVEVSFPSSEDSEDDRTSFQPTDIIRVRVKANFHCQVPFVAPLVCGLLSGTRAIRGEAAMPNQGAMYPATYGLPEVVVPPKGPF